MSDQSASPPSIESLVDSHYAPPASSSSAAPTKPDAAGGAAAATGQPTTTPPAPERPYYFKAKVDREEREVDLAADWPDEVKRKGHIDTYQQGLAHPAILARARGEALTNGQKDVLDRLAKQGFTWKQDASVEGGWRFDRTVATPGPAAAAAASPLDNEIAALEKKTAEETITAAEIVKLARLERQRDAEKATAAEARRTQEAQAAKTKTEREQSIDDALLDELGSDAKAFEGTTAEVANGLKAVAWELARQASLSKNETPDQAKGRAKNVMARIHAFVNARVAHLTKPPDPSKAPPAFGGTAAGATKKPTNEMSIEEQVNDWASSAHR